MGLTYTYKTFGQCSIDRGGKSRNEGMNMNPKQEHFNVKGGNVMAMETLQPLMIMTNGEKKEG